MTFAVLCAAGGLGAWARWLVSGLVHRGLSGTRPWGTAVVNISGALLLGLLYSAGDVGAVPATVARVSTAGFLGGYTTFSTWMVETTYLTEEGGGAGRRAALINLLGSFAVGTVAVMCGLWLGRWL